MVKILVLILVLSVRPLYGQEPVKQKAKNREYIPQTIAISQRLGGFSEAKNRVSASTSGDVVVVADGAEFAHYGNATTVIEFFTQIRKGRSQYTPMLSFRFSFPFSSNGGLYGKFRGGFLFGGSQYLFDLRNRTTGLGWSMLANGGFIIDLPTISEMKELRYPVILGGEVDFKVIYNVHKYVGITFGFNMGYQISLDLSKTNTESGGIPEFIITNGFSWNLNFGLIF